MQKKGLLLFCVNILIAFIFITGCKNAANSSELKPDKAIPNLTAPEVTLKLSETDPQSTVIISWTASDGAEFYNVRKMSIRDGIKDIQFIDSISLGNDESIPLLVVDKECESDTEYVYVVSAGASGEDWIEYEDIFTNKVEKSYWYIKDSEKKSIKTAKSNEITLDYPKKVTVTAKPGNTNALAVSWDPVDGALSYEVYMLEGILQEHNEYFKKIAETTETFHIEEHLYNERTLVFRVRAVNGNNYSLFSAKIEAEVPKTENLSMNQAMILNNNICENIVSESDTLWFKCTPEKGLVKYNILGSSDDFNQSTLSIFSKDGLLLATGLPLFITEEDRNKLFGSQQCDLPVSYQFDQDTGKEWVIRDIKKDLQDFTEGTEYILRLSKPKWSLVSICIE